MRREGSFLIKESGSEGEVHGTAYGCGSLPPDVLKENRSTVYPKTLGVIAIA